MNIIETLQKYKNNLPQYIIVQGDNDWLRNYSRDRLVKTISKNNTTFELKTFNCDSDIKDIINSMGKTPFIEKNKLIVLNNTNLFASNTKDEKTSKICNTELANGNILIICAVGKIDKRKQIVKKIISQGIIIECDIIKKADYLKWLYEYIKNSDLNLSNIDASYALEYCGGEIQDTISELHKIQIVCGNNITKKEINKYIVPSFQHSVFKMHDLLCNKKIKEGITILENILVEESSPIGMLKLLYNFFRQMSDVQDYYEAGYNKNLIIQNIKEDWRLKNDWQAENIYKSSFNFENHKIKKGIRKLAEFDFGIKQGIFNAKSDIISKVTEIYS